MQLVNAQTGGHVWSMHFDKALQGIFELQDAIALEVARALSISLDACVTLKQQGTTHFDAYLEYVQGAKLLATWRTADTKAAAEHAARAASAAAEADCRKALELNPSDAQAYEGLANVLNENPPRRAEVLMLIDRARKWDPLESRLDGVKAAFLFHTRGDLDGAEKLLTNALQRDHSTNPRCR